MKTDNFCIGVVTFYPNKTTISNLKKLLKSGIFLIIIDNTPNPNEMIFNTLRLNNNLELISNKRNIGLSSAIKQLLYLATKKSFDSMLYLDQDTFLKVDINYFRKLLIKINNNFFNENYAIQYLLPINIKINYDVVIGPNSGTFFNLKYFNKYNLLPKDFFVEMIDFYICLYIRKFKLKANYISMENIFDHSNLDSMTFSFGFKNKLYFRLYSPKRLVEIFMKSCFLIKQSLSFKDISFILVLLIYDFKLFISQLLFFAIFSVRKLPFVNKTDFITKLKN